MAGALVSRLRARRGPALAALVCAALWAGAGAAGAAGRVALLIGNGDYAGDGLDLRNPANDAAAFGAALRELGFAATVLTDADRAGAEAALDAFADEARGAEMALFFFAGHGVQVDGENYLLASDFAALEPEALDGAAITLTEVSERLARAAPGVGFIVLDACRNNPFAASGAAARGLARARGGAGLLIAYATDPGNVAYDGAGENSVFTAALVENVGAPGVEARLMFGRVRQAVALASGGLQVPWVEEAVLGEHYLRPAARPVAPDPGLAREIEAWRGAVAGGAAAGYRGYLDAYPDGAFAVFARERLERPEGAAAAAGADPAALVAEADRVQLAVALSALGFLSPVRGQAPDDAELATGLGGWLRQSGGDAGAGLDSVYLDAAQVTVMLGATTAQRIRAQMAALAGIERVRGIVATDRARLAALAAAEPAAAGAALAGAEADAAEIEALRERVLEQLDASRSYYAELVERGETALRPWLARSLPGLIDRARGLPAAEGRLVEDAGTFIRHASEAGARRPEGSYAWLADFLPRD